VDGKENTQQRTYLCPACDGLGEWEHRPGGDPQQATEHACHECSGTGVVTADRDAHDLIPWTGDRGLAARRNSRPHMDPLLQLVPLRANAVRQWKAWPRFFNVELTAYGFLRGVHLRERAAFAIFEAHVRALQAKPAPRPTSFDMVGFANALMAGDQRGIARAMGVAA
jgi:hypothetical protein